MTAIEKKFTHVRTSEGNPKWEACMARKKRLYQRPGDVRSEFYRDYTRILHSLAYRRLKHKTQVFFATENDHICTRIEHVNHVASVSYTIADMFGLNTELVSAIAIGHDLGHAPFGHWGEVILRDITHARLGEDFWHEKNSLYFVDNIELLPNQLGEEINLDLTYAVRDGIISHCGEMNEPSISPRAEDLDLNRIKSPGEYPPFTWEGCVVKIADKIAFLGRDIEDALDIGILDDEGAKDELKGILRRTGRDLGIREINNTVLMNEFILDLNRSSSPEAGIRLSEDHHEFLKAVRDFNYRRIYDNARLLPFKAYARLIINSMFDRLMSVHGPDLERTRTEMARNREYYPSLMGCFEDWLLKYSDLDPERRKAAHYSNRLLYRVEDKASYTRAAVDYISGMTDKFAIRCFNELTSFK